MDIPLFRTGLLLNETPVGWTNMHRLWSEDFPRYNVISNDIQIRSYIALPLSKPFSSSIELVFFFAVRYV